MCLAVYIATTHQIPLIAWDKENPAFYTKELDYHDKRVRKQFDLENVYYAGSNEGCGCGFLKDGVVGEELELTKANYLKLSEVVRSAQNQGFKVQIFSCWEGGQTGKIEIRKQIAVDDLIADEFEFEEQALYEIV